MNLFRISVVAIEAAVLACGCNPQFDFDVPDGGKMSSAGGTTGVADPVAFEQCNTRCSVWGQVCAPEWMVCVECNEDKNCTVSGKPRCWVEDHRCVECATDTDCGTGQHCVSQTGECRPACNFTSTDDICSSDGDKCGDSNVCISCNQDQECTTTNRGKRCLPGCGYCVACLTDADCGGTTPRCDTVDHMCVTCKDGRDCASHCCDTGDHTCYSM